MLFEILYDFVYIFLVMLFMFCFVFLWLNMQVIAVTYWSHGDIAVAIVAIDTVKLIRS